MPKPHVTVIIGPPRTGKTLLAKALMDRLHREGKSVVDLSGEPIATFKSACAGEPIDMTGESIDHVIYTTNDERPSGRADLYRRADVLVRTSTKE